MVNECVQQAEASMRSSRGRAEQGTKVTKGYIFPFNSEPKLVKSFVFGAAWRISELIKP